MKKFVVLLISICFAFVPAVLCGCNSLHTAGEVRTLYLTMKNEYSFGNFLSVPLDTSKVVPQGKTIGEDKAQVFTDVYAYYLDLSSGFLVSVFDRNMSATFLSDYSNDELNELYNKLNSTYIRLKNLSEEINIYETSDGNLHYKEVVNCYNIVVDKFFDLSYYFAGLYFSKNRFDFSSIQELSTAGTNLNDFVWYELCLLSRISFGTEVVNYAYSNPLGSIDGWLDRSEYVKSTLTLAQRILPKLKAHNTNLTNYISSNGSANALNIIKNMQNDRENFLRQYNGFVYCKNSVSFATYINLVSEEEKNNYLAIQSNETISKYNIIFDFLSGKYAGRNSAFLNIANYINN